MYFPFSFGNRKGAQPLWREEMLFLGIKNGQEWALRRSDGSCDSLWQGFSGDEVNIYLLACDKILSSWLQNSQWGPMTIKVLQRIYLWQVREVQINPLPEFSVSKCLQLRLINKPKEHIWGKHSLLPLTCIPIFIDNAKRHSMGF